MPCVGIVRIRPSALPLVRKSAIWSGSSLRTRHILSTKFFSFFFFLPSAFIREKRTAGGLDVVDRVSIELEHLGGLRLLLLVAAHGESVLRHLDKDVVAFLPLFPHAFAPRVQVPGEWKKNAIQDVRSSTDQSLELDRSSPKTQAERVSRSIDRLVVSVGNEVWFRAWTNSYPQCFILSGLSMRQAILIRKSLSTAFLGTSILCHSGNWMERSENTFVGNVIKRRAFGESLPWKPTESDAKRFVPTPCLQERTSLRLRRRVSS